MALCRARQDFGPNVHGGTGHLGCLIEVGDKGKRAGRAHSLAGSQLLRRHLCGVVASAMRACCGMLVVAVG